MNNEIEHLVATIDAHPEPLHADYPAEVRALVRIGLPLGLISALYSIGHVFLQALYNLQGSDFVAGCSVGG